jgi:hypothetical protein
MPQLLPPMGLLPPQLQQQHPLFLQVFSQFCFAVFSLFLDKNNE